MLLNVLVIYHGNKAVIDLKLKNQLETIYNQFHSPQYFRIDPLLCVHKFTSGADREIAGLIAAVLAYGRAEIIIRNCNCIFEKISGDIGQFLSSTTFTQKQQIFKTFKHRFNDGFDIALLLECLREIKSQFETLEEYFLSLAGSEDFFMRDALHNFATDVKLRGARLAGFRKKSFEYLFPSPHSGSACKRLNMYMRWMVRREDSIDFGVWKNVSPSRLIIPVDTHIAHLSRELGLSRRNTADWKMAEEITDGLRKFDPSDPVRYDFSLCRAGMVDFRREAA